MTPTPSIRFALQLGATAVGAFLDYFVGVLSQRPSLGILSWAIVIVVAAAILDFTRETWQHHHTGPSSPGQTGGWAYIIRRRHPSGFGWHSVVAGIWAAAFTAIATYALALCVITIRYTAQPGTSLGEYSPYNHSAVALITSFQSSPSMRWFIAASFVLAITVRPAIVLPLGIVVISLMNALHLPLSPLSAGGAEPASQLAVSLSVPDTWLFKLPQNALLLGSAAAFAIGILACGVVNRLLR